jgi:hypothetical protein
MWSLGKVFNTPEVVRVYVGSFWDQQNKDVDQYPLLQAEQADLLNDLRDLPRNAAIRKINEIVKRARLAKVTGFHFGALQRRTLMDVDVSHCVFAVRSMPISSVI